MNEENKNLEENIKRHIDVMLEHMDERFDAIIEDQCIIKEKVEKIDLLVEDMDYVKSTLTDNKERFKETADKTTVDDHETRIVKLENTALAKA
ncbi:MAG: hypothetical protein WCV59_03755 [Parcubacteria group bacterium]|jgi:hypothetical protein